jgi:hypothetical protein
MEIRYTFNLSYVSVNANSYNHKYTGIVGRHGTATQLSVNMGRNGHHRSVSVASRLSVLAMQKQATPAMAMAGVACLCLRSVASSLCCHLL